jgi:hypothetical protein
MIADFFTKPLQGELFRRFRDVVMGHKHINSLINQDDKESLSQERVSREKMTWDDERPKDVRCHQEPREPPEIMENRSVSWSRE